MDPHPKPPGSQSRIDKLDLKIHRTARDWYRVFLTKRDPLWYGEGTGSRYDAPKGEYGVMYVAAKAEGAFIETFGRMLGVRLIGRKKLEARSFAILETDGLALVDLTGKGLSKMGIDGRICTDDYRLTQAWSLAFYKHHSQPDGIRYRSRHDPSQFCAAIFGRATSKVREAKRIDLATRRGQTFVAPIVDYYEFGLTGRYTQRD